MLSFTLQTNAQVPLTANVVDQLGEPAQSEMISWSVADENVAGIDATSGGTINLVAHGEGSTTVAVTLGSLTTLLHVTVARVVASSVSIEIGTPVAKAIALPVVEAIVDPVPLDLPAEAASDGVPASVEAMPHPAEPRAIETHPEAPQTGEETGREAAEPAAPPAPVEATTHDTPAAA